MAIDGKKLKSIHPFPARMAPSIVLNKLADAKSRLTVLDPMSGSGTTLVAARLRGHRAIGFDTDPLAVLIARTWCSNIDPSNVRDKANTVVARSKQIYGE